MKYRMLDENSDYSFGRSQQDLTYGVYAVALAIKSSLLLLRSEWFENTSLGLPLFQQIIGQTGAQQNIELADSLIRTTILNVPNVNSISDFSSKLENRTYSFTATVTTPFGNVTVAKTF